MQLLKNLTRLITLILLGNLLTACVNGPVSINKDQDSSPEILSAQIHIKLGLAYLASHNTAAAKEKLLQALQDAPEWPPAYDAMAYFLEKTGDVNRAAVYYQRAVSLSPSPHDGLALNNYGAYLCRQHNARGAEAYFMKALNDPDYLYTAQIYENAGLCALSIHNYFKARYYFKKALAHDPRLPLSTLELNRLNSL